MSGKNRNLEKKDPEQGPVWEQDHKHRLNLFVVFHFYGSNFVWAEKVKSGGTTPVLTLSRLSSSKMGTQHRKEINESQCG